MDGGEIGKEGGGGRERGCLLSFGGGIGKEGRELGGGGGGDRERECDASFLFLTEPLRCLTRSRPGLRVRRSYRAPLSKTFAETIANTSQRLRATRASWRQHWPGIQQSQRNKTSKREKERERERERETEREA